MTTTIVAATLTVTHTESLSLLDAESNDHGTALTNTFTIAAVKEVVKRIVEVTTTETGLVSFAADEITVVGGTPFPVGYVAGHFDEDAVRYMRITNKDNLDKVTLKFRSGTKEFAVILDAGQSFIFGADNAAGVVAAMDASATALTVALTGLDDITAVGDAAVDLEIYIALA